jgi:hypothetical protein
MRKETGTNQGSAMKRAFFLLTAVAASLGVQVCPLLANAAESDPFSAVINDPLHGKWSIFTGRLDPDVGIYFERATQQRAGVADFRNLVQTQRQVQFDPKATVPDKHLPYGTYNYAYSEKGVLTLSQPDGDLPLYVKYKEEESYPLGEDEAFVRPNLVVLYDPQARRAFKLVRLGTEIGSIDLSRDSRFEEPPDGTGTEPDRSNGDTVFVPFQDRLAGQNWRFADGRSTFDGKVEFALNSPTSRQGPLLEVRVDNRAVLNAGDRRIELQFRQYDPSHRAFRALGAGRTSGVLVVEDAVQGLLGPNTLLTRWKIDGRTLTAVLRASESSPVEAVPAVRFEDATPFRPDALFAPQ